MKKKITSNKLYKTDFSSAEIGKMTKEQLQSNIEKYAKRVNQRITDIQRYGDQNGLDMSSVLLAARRELGGIKASRSKISSESEGRWRLRRIMSVYSMHELTRTGQKQMFSNRKAQYEWVMNKKLTQTQARKLDNALGGLEIRAMDSETWIDLANEYAKNDAFDGDVDAFIEWLDKHHINYLDEYKQLLKGNNPDNSDIFRWE